MICVSIQRLGLDEIFKILETQDIDMAEIRLDRCPLTLEETDTLFSCSEVPLLATCRIAESSVRTAQERLLAAIDAGAWGVDLEIEAPPQMGKLLRSAARRSGVTFIRSCHDTEGTPSEQQLHETVGKLYRFGADIAKVVTTARSEQDCERIASLYSSFDPSRLIAFCLGSNGSRKRSLSLGAPFAYACASECGPSADGQMTNDDFRKEVYGSASRYLWSNVTAPTSKSYAQRAIIAAALARGTTTLEGYSACGDCESAIEVARKLGATVHEGETLVIEGTAPRSTHIKELNVGESGLLARLCIPLLALKNDGALTVTGRGTLPDRPLVDAANIMASFGVVLRNEGGCGGREAKVPLRVEGRLVSGRADISGRGGSQIISGLLMSLPLCDKNSTLYVHDPRSIPYMVMTLDILRQFGIEIASEMEGDDEFLQTQDWSLCTSMNYRIKGGQNYRATRLTLEGDWSGAAAFLTLGAIFGRMRVEGLNSDSLQADITIMDILSSAGACISEEEDSRAITAHKAPLHAIGTDLNNAPDLFPVVAVLAAFCQGESHISGLGRLTSKESDRASAILEMLSALGVEADRDGDTLIVQGMSLAQRCLTGHALHGGSFTSRHDHRMVMALKVAAQGASSPVVIDDEACVAKSFPEFNSIMASI